MSIPISKLRVGGVYAKKGGKGNARRVVHLGPIRVDGYPLMYPDLAYVELGTDLLTLDSRPRFARWADLQRITSEEAEG